jgi:hypothetical protein
MLGAVELGQVEKLLSTQFETLFADNKGYSVNKFNGGDLVSKLTYSDNSLKTLLFTKVFNYNGLGDLTSIVCTRISDGMTLTKNLIINADGDLIAKKWEQV